LGLLLLRLRAIDRIKRRGPVIVLFKKKSVFLWLLVLFLSAGTTVSCTTNDDAADGLEDEQLAEDEQSSSEGVVAEESSSEEAADEDVDVDEEDEEFLAEDAADPNKKSTDELEEKSLQNELEKENIATNTEAPVETQDPVPLKDQTAAGTAATVEVQEDNVQPPSAATTGPVVAADTSLSNDGFEVINPSLPQEDLGVSDPLVAEVDPPLPSTRMAQDVVPLAKIKTDPFYRNQRLMNTVYIARANEDLPIISQKIFGEDRTEMLIDDNPHLKKGNEADAYQVSRGIEAGDKIYYNSPTRPEDKKEIITYYEDKKMSPQYYVTRKGDDIKKIGREVLGSDDGWKEIWATNDVLQSQALLPAGLKIRYWSGSEPSLSEISQTQTAMSPSSADSSIVSAPEPVPETLPDIPPSPEIAPIASEDPGLSNAPPVPSDSNMASFSGGETPSVQAPSEQNSSSLMTIAAVAMIAMAGIGIVAIQIKNRKKDTGAIPPSLEFTKV
jgi:hypothetical protein